MRSTGETGIYVTASRNDPDRYAQLFAESEPKNGEMAVIASRQPQWAIRLDPQHGSAYSVRIVLCTAVLRYRTFSTRYPFF
eukprot:SAG11_NODE_130_length_15497_cov_10.780556_3_plen_81_part_00